MRAAVENAMNIVCSRPIWSETQPKNGRPKPSKIRSSEIAKGQRGIWKPRMPTVRWRFEILAIGAICAAVIRPPAATITNTRYITQKIGLRSTCGGVKSILVCGRLSCFFFAGITATACAGKRQQANDHALSDAKGEERGLVAARCNRVGDRDYVIAAPAPKPAAVAPAARPRGREPFSALPTQVPYTAPAPIRW